MRLLEDDYLGGSGSRGYGKVSFKNLDIQWQPIQNYEYPEKKPVLLLEKTNPQKALEDWNAIVQKICL
jgi:CRISPR-associated protein Csm3